MTARPVISELEKLRAEIATLRQILEVHERTTFEQSRRSEEALARVQREEQRYRSLVAATAAIVWTVDGAGRFVEPQPSWQAYTGQIWEEHRDRGWTNAIHADDRDDVRDRWEQARERRTLYHAEGRLYHAPTQTYRFFTARAVPIVEHDGQVREWIGTITDVDERRRAEEALRISDERFRVLSRATNDAIWDWNLADNTLWWNDAITTLFGYARAEVGPEVTWWYEHVHQDDRESVVAGIHEVIDTGGTNWSAEYRYARADGTYLDVFDRGFVIRGNDGTPLRMLGAMQDISARNRRAAQLRRLAEASMTINSNRSVQEISQAVTDAARGLISAHQAVTSLTVNSDRAQATYALSLSEKYAAWPTDDARPDGSGIFALVCETNTPLRLTQDELEHHPRWQGLGQQARHPLMNGWLAVPLVGRDGRNLGLIQLFDKTVGEFTAEDEGILTQLAQIASTSIENARLYEEARTANKAKDDFFATLSHELRTPMTSIIGWTRLLTMDPDAETLREAVAAITTSADTQARLIDDLLDVSRVMTGKFALEMKPLDFTALAEETAKAMKPSAAAKRVAIAFRGSTNCTITGDALRLRQVVNNLASNAIKFTPAGGIVNVSVASDENSAVLTVADTGEGIQREFLPHVFDRYAQQGIARHGGLGLGLAIVKHIVERHGGSVGVDSAGEGKGATFTVRLPLAKMSLAT